MKNEFFDLSWLQANHKTIHFFGLGFIQLKLNEKERLHFYHPDLVSFVEQPHNHRYDFTSEVIKGGLLNLIWKEDPNDLSSEACTLRFDACTADNGIQVPESKFTYRKLVTKFVTMEGSSYYMPKELFHQVKPLVEPTITYLIRGSKQCEFAKILEPKEFKPLCPFSKNLPENELWEFVKNCLD